ncbi:MAG TPA: uracil phosphoribosyltransferase, partial [Promineifilum sp.]|nr:uracil phosphoribosyltransferase [Promineifilum sp.]
MIYESKHPLVKHKLTLMRDVKTKPKKFRQLVREISMLLCYEATADLATAPITVESPMGVADGMELIEKVGLIPVLRA